jgi:mono/diheme cytochrome c family protein
MRARGYVCARVAVTRTAWLLVLLAALVGAAEGAAEVREQPALPSRDRAVRVPDDPQLRRGFEIWAVLCAPCHGQTGKGDGLVAGLLTIETTDLTDPDAIVFDTDRERMQVIAEGLEGSPMIGWKEVLTEREIGILNGYLRYILKPKKDGNRKP